MIMSNKQLVFRSQPALLLAGVFFAGTAMMALAAETKESGNSPVAAPTPPVEPAASVESTGPSTPVDLPAAPSQNVTINLINRLVQRGVLPKEDAVDLIKQAENDAAIARAQAAAATPPPVTDDTVRVTYVPETVKAQIRDELKQEVMEQARSENWANPRTLPPWVTRVRLFGDIRIRGEGAYYPTGNLTGLGSNYWNYNAINTASTPYDYTGVANPAYANVDKDRYRLRLRARVGVEADLGDGFTAGIRIGTGENSSPISQNQTLGGTGGNFSKYALWLDRGFVKYELGTADRNFSFSLGRFDNPFFSTKMIWNDDLGFDGLALQGRYKVTEHLTPFLIAGAFPVYNTDLNFATYSPTKFSSHDKWLEAVQGGLEWKITKDWTAKFAAAYYYYQNVEGQVSTQFTPVTNTDSGNTDITRPSFAQKGNTYIALRDIASDVSNNYGTTNQWQYFGLATPFHELALTARLDLNRFDPFHVWLVGEYTQNLAFDHSAILANGPSNLSGPVNNIGSNNVFGGGDTGWILTLNFGSVALEKPWDWNIAVGYRYVESDAVIDAFCDDNFGGGGTNLKGFTIGGSVAITPRTSLGIRWMSADSISGVPYKEDLIQLDFNAKF